MINQTYQAVLCTLHPGDLFSNPKMALPMRLDWQKVRHCLNGTWPEKVPPFEVVKFRSEVTQHVEKWCNEAVAKAKYVVVDTEFSRESRWLATLGMGYPGMGSGLQVWFAHLDPVSRSVVRNSFLDLVKKVPVVYQNAMADIPVLEQNLGVKYEDYCQIEDTMLAHAVLWSEWPHTLEYLASIYGKYPKMKHLSAVNPELYNWGDVLDTISVWEGLQRELTKDPASERVYREQSLRLIPILLKRAKAGIATDQEAVQKAAKDLEDRTVFAVGLAHAGAGYPINIGSDTQLKTYLYDFKDYPVQLSKERKPTVDSDAITNLRKHLGPMPDLDTEAADGLSLEAALERIQEGADSILEARVIYAAAKQEKTHFIRPLEGQVRVYPSIKIHAQASGRWSITEPPLQQFPGYLGSLLVPDPGEVWMGWDWDQVELRVLAALCKDKLYLEAFENDWDVHTLNACAIFSLPEPADKKDPHRSEVDSAWRMAAGWVGKEDIRRTFAKRFVYRLNYGGDPRTAGDIPGAAQLGLNGNGLVTASNRYLAAHPAMAAWRVEVAANARVTGVSRTFMGRRRRLLGEGRAIVREAYNHPMQGAVSDILNVCTVQISEACPGAVLVYTVHDAAWWSVRAGEDASFRRIVNPIITQTWNIGGVHVGIPAKWKDKRVHPGDQIAVREACE